MMHSYFIPVVYIHSRFTKKFQKSLILTQNFAKTEHS